jgi:guanylate kinase
MLFVLSGPSGVGKTTLVRKLVESYPNRFWVSVSYTTRPKKRGEEEGKDYLFVSREAFKEKISKGVFLEWARVYDDYYGTPLAPLEEALKKGYNVLLDIDVQGGLEIQNQREDVTLVLIVPPSLSVLETRLKDRGRDDAGELKRRLGMAMAEMERACQRYEYLIVNEDPAMAIQETYRITQSAPLKLKSRKQRIFDGFLREWEQRATGA